MLRKQIFSALICSSFFAATAVAGGFQIFEQSGNTLGNIQAGAAAAGTDPSTEFFNPAAMVLIHHQEISSGAVYIPVDNNFRGTIGGVPTPPGGIWGSSSNIVPNFHYVLPIGKKFVFGFGITAPFGLETKYPNIAPVNRAATQTRLVTINFNPSLAFAITKFLSVAIGVDLLTGKARYNNFLATPGLSGPFLNKLTGSGVGYNLGLLLQLSKKIRIGASYRSDIVLDGHGTSRFGPLTSNNLSAKLHLPGTLIVGAYAKINKKISLMFSVLNTYWNVFNQILFRNTAIAPILNIPQNFHNTWTGLFGGTWQINKKWRLLMGVIYDTTPTRNNFRNIRLPDADRWGAGIGFNYQATKHILIGGGLLHYFESIGRINNSGQMLPLVDQGTTRNHVDIVGLQFTYIFSKTKK